MNYYINSEAIDRVNEGRDIPGYLNDEYGNRAFRVKYHATDGWRGYYKVTPVKKYGWEATDFEGWVTGNWSDAPEEARSENVEDKIEKYAQEQEAEGYEVTVVFTPTSNVFSTSYDVFRRPVSY